MPKYFIHVAFEQGAPQRIYGPFDTIPEAHDFGQPFAEEGLDVECRGEELICDFCSDPAVEWGYPAEDFVIQGGHILGGAWGSRGGWAACAHCHDLIEDNNQAGLVAYSVKTFFERHSGEVPDNQKVRMAVTRHVMEVHSMFFMAKFGQDAQKGRDEPRLR
jgi:hypothetical protein